MVYHFAAKLLCQFSPFALYLDKNKRERHGQAYSDIPLKGLLHTMKSITRGLKNDLYFTIFHFLLLLIMKSHMRSQIAELE